MKEEGEVRKKNLGSKTMENDGEQKHQSHKNYGTAGTGKEVELFRAEDWAAWVIFTVVLRVFFMEAFVLLPIFARLVVCDGLLSTL